MAMPIPASVVREYNGVTMPVNIRTTIEEDPVPSGDTRVNKYSKITFNIRGFWTQNEADEYAAANGLAAGLPLDQLMLSIRLRLQANCKTFKWTGTGYGPDLVVNDPAGTVWDVAMGPKAGKFTFYSLGGAPDGAHGCGFTWSISICIPECKNARYFVDKGVWSEVSFGITYDQDERGLVTITTKGVGQVPLTLPDVLTTNVDDWISDIIAPVPLGFIRKMSRTLSNDRTTCNFTVVDKQIEVPFPPGVVSMRMRHKIRQPTISEFRWNATITGEVVLDPTVNKLAAWQAFFGIAIARVLYARNRGGNAPPGGGITPPKFEMDENIFENEARFSITYNIVGTLLSKIIHDSCLWTPVTNIQIPAGANGWNFTTWRQSLQNTAQKTKGILGASFKARNEVIIDVCNPRVGAGAAAGVSVLAASADSVNESSGSAANSGGASTLAPSDNELSLNDLNLIEPIVMIQPKAGGQDSDQLADGGQSLFDPDDTWISWECSVEPVTDYRLVRHKPLAGTVTMQTPDVDPLGAVEDVAGATADPTPGWTASVPDIIQQTASPSMALRLRGYAIRVAYRIQEPRLISYGGVTPVLAYSECPEISQPGGGGVVYYVRRWDLIYWLPTAPSSLPLPANPATGTDGTAA